MQLRVLRDVARNLMTEPGAERLIEVSLIETVSAVPVVQRCRFRSWKKRIPVQLLELEPM